MGWQQSFNTCHVPNDDSQLNEPQQAERNLWASVLLLAVEDLHGRGGGEGHGTSREALAQDAAEWLFSNDTDEGSFIWICRVLNLDFAVVRRVLGNPAGLSTRMRVAVNGLQAPGANVRVDFRRADRGMAEQSLNHS